MSYGHQLSAGLTRCAPFAQLRRTAVGSGTGSKEAATAFRRLALSPDGTRSLVACRPLTGRTHQARRSLALCTAASCACMFALIGSDDDASLLLLRFGLICTTTGSPSPTTRRTAAAPTPPRAPAPAQRRADEAAAGDDSARFAPRARVDGAACGDDEKKKMTRSITRPREASLRESGVD
jgi:hypothetical protein